MKKMTLAAVAVVALTLAQDVQAGNPAPLYTSPVYLGGANPNYGKKRVKKAPTTQTQPATTTPTATTPATTPTTAATTTTAPATTTTPTATTAPTTTTTPTATTTTTPSAPTTTTSTGNNDFDF